MFLVLFSCEKSVNQRRISTAEEFIKTFYLDDSYEFSKVFNYLVISESEFYEMSNSKQNEFKDFINKSFSEFNEFLTESNKKYYVVSYDNLDQSLLKEYNLSKSLINENLIFLVNDDKIISFFLFNEEDKIESFIPDPWLSKHKRKIIPLHMDEFIK